MSRTTLETALRILNRRRNMGSPAQRIQTRALIRSTVRAMR